MDKHLDPFCSLAHPRLLNTNSDRRKALEWRPVWASDILQVLSRKCNHDLSSNTRSSSNTGSHSWPKVGVA
jgi:hypothetical protein